MRTEGMRALEKQLRARAPAGVEALSEQDLGDLAEAVQAARRRQAEALDVAANQALDHIPRLLRGPIRKVVG